MNLEVDTTKCRKGGKSPRKTFKFTPQDMAKAAGKSMEAVRKDRQRGMFKNHDLRSVCLYVASQIAKREARLL